MMMRASRFIKSASAHRKILLDTLDVIQVGNVPIQMNVFWFGEISTLIVSHLR